MKKRRTENFIILLISVGVLGLVIVSIILKWEFWVPPVLAVGMVLLWVICVTERVDFEIRKAYYLLYSMLALFFHGVHETSFFDVSLVFVGMMIGFSFLESVYMINMLLAEYVVVMLMQIMLSVSSGGEVLDTLGILRLIMHIAFTLMVYFCSLRSIYERTDWNTLNQQKDVQIEAYEADMEDFLSNISHELRTPINVVNGISDLLIKRNVGQDAYSIKDAGIRLAYQVEDIQDYTECKRGKVMLEDEVYMGISLINDVVTSFRMLDNDKGLELVVDFSPFVPLKMKGDVKKLHKIFRHLLENAVKFTKHGGILVRMYTERMEYGVNLCIEMTDTGIGMNQKAMESVAEGMYQVNKKRNRSSGGIGLGLFIVHGFVHKMGGFVKLESEPKAGTTVRLTIPQLVMDSSPSLSLSEEFSGDVLFHVRSQKYKIPKVRDFYRIMAANLAAKIHVPLYSAETVQEIERLREKLNVSYIFMGQEEYEENAAYFDELSRGDDVVVVVSASAGFAPNPGSQVMVMPKPLYAYPAVKILNEGRDARNIEFSDNTSRPVFRGVKALIVDDEPMNLIVATGLFADYEMVCETASGGKEAIEKYRTGNYDVVFMDHMMPEMDGVEAMKQIKQVAVDQGKYAIVIALTANAVSGAKEMFIKEGFDGFIAKPINRLDFERVMRRELPGAQTEGGEAA